MRRTTITLLLGLLVACSAEVPEPTPGTGKAGTAYDRGLDFLMSQTKDGNFGNPGFSALGVSGFLVRPGGVRPGDREFVDACLKSIAANQRDDGGIYEQGVANYTTCVAIMALAASGNAEYEPVIAKAAGFVKSLQQESGGIGYSDSHPGEPDLSNTQFAIEALRSAGVPKDDPVFSKAARFLQSVQNDSESNNAEYTLEDGRIVVIQDDGGAFYKPGESKAGIEELPDGRVAFRSYGSMTYALLKCYLLAGVPKTDPRVQAAVRWVKNNYTLEENPGFETAKDPGAAKQGYFYYLMMMAKALDLLDVDTVKDKDGIEHDWRAEIRAELESRQKEDGSWVNEADRWYEGMPVIATSYALITLADCAK